MPKKCPQKRKKSKRGRGLAQKIKQAEAEIVPSSSLVEVRVEVDVGVDVGVEVDIEVDVEVISAILGGWCGEMEIKANISQS